MSLNKYIMSKSVRDYFDQNDFEIGYMTAFWVIIHTPYMYNEYMIRDLKKLISETEDCSIDDLCMNINIVPTFHSLVRYYIDYYYDRLKLFEASEPNSKYSIYDANLFDNKEGGFITSCSSYGECVKEIKTRTGKYCNADKKSFGIASPLAYVIRKVNFDRYDYMNLIIDRDLKVLDLTLYRDSELSGFLREIDGLDYGEIPLPFKPGDIVKEAFKKEWISNLVYIGQAYGDDGYGKPQAICDSVTGDFEIVNYIEANPFNMELCDPREKDIYPLTHITSYFEQKNMSIGDFLHEFKTIYSGGESSCVPQAIA